MKIKLCSILIIILLILCSGVAAAQRLTVEARFANIRSGPGTNYDILWNVEKYHPVFVLKKTGSWYHFRDFEGDEGWIHNSLLGKTPAIITAKEKCNIRSGPGNAYKIMYAIGKGIPFKIIKRKGSWINIQHADGDKGWIYKSLVW